MSSSNPNQNTQNTPQSNRNQQRDPRMSGFENYGNLSPLFAQTGYRPSVDAPIYSPNPYFVQGYQPVMNPNILNFNPFTDFVQPQTQNVPEMQTQSQPQNFPETQTQTENIPSSPEEVPETQPTNANVDRRRKATSQKWTTQEEVALARSWIDVSEDAAAGNSQALDHFWFRITERFHREVGRPSYRSKDSLTTKYREINRVVMKFNGLYHNLKTQRKSGQTDQNVFEEALKIFRAENNGKVFRYVDFWRVVEPCKKWHDSNATEEVPARKRSKTSETTNTTTNTTSSDARINLDLNEAQDDLEFPEMVRPIGRDAAKRKGKSKAGSSSTTEISDDLSEMRMSFQEYNAFLGSRLEMQKKNA